MRRTSMIVLVLMGGGVALLSGRSIGQCQTTLQTNPQNANLACRQFGGRSIVGSGFVHTGGVSTRTGIWGRGASSIASVVRGGFGHFGGGRGS